MLKTANKQKLYFISLALTLLIAISGCGGGGDGGGVTNGGNGGGNGGGSGGESGGYPIVPAGTISIAWDANTEPDLDGYIVYYGTASGSYKNSIPLSKMETTATLAGLTKGQTYFIALKAFDTSGNMSDFSNEVSGAAN